MLKDLRKFQLDVERQEDECDGEGVEAALSDSIASLPHVASSTIRRG